MTNDPNDRFMIGDISSKRSAHIKEEDNTASPSSLRRRNSLRSSNSKAPRTDRDIEEAFASDIKPISTGGRVPADAMFNDLEEALGMSENEIRNRQFRQKQIYEEQMRQAQQEHAAERILTRSLYPYDPGQHYRSLYSGHAIKPSDMPVKKKVIRQSVAEPATADYSDTVSSEPAADYPDSVSSEAGSPVTSSPMDDDFNDASLDTDDLTTVYSYTDHSEDRRNSWRRIGFIVSLTGVLLVCVLLFFLIRSLSSKIMGFVGGKSESVTSSSVESAARSGGEDGENTENAENAENTENTENTEVNSQAASEPSEESSYDNNASDSISEPTDTSESAVSTNEAGLSGEIPEDPNDIDYLAYVNKKAADDAIAGLSPEAPRIYLTSYAIKISAGTSFNSLAYIENLEDDQDDRNRLSRDISIDGLRELNTNVPGTYELIYYCYDSSTNRSNNAKMTVIVE